MHADQLKQLIDAGHYRPEPAEIAQAMLRRRAVRALLTGVRGAANDNGKLSLSPADRIQSPSAAPRQAA